MKTILAVVAATATLFYLPAQVSSTAQCLYCRRSDFTATFLVSYSYCAATDTCLQDRWNYIDRPCTTKWVRGVKTELEACAPKKVTCHDFVSTEEAAGNWFNYTETLGANEYCVITVNTAAFMGRVVVDEALTVGLQFTSAANATYNSTLDIGKQLTVDMGNVVTLYAYNGDTSGSITFTLAFRDARYLQMVAKSVVAVTAMLFAISAF
ncbi:hypothetical protein FGO68_gene9025 [Halteria grandinella]|uniref:Uncharacterized protein n=1 Tax=Halteria grandinella TaxID=5974 RepID=A0A8J8NCK4_HALGN|nr:hypothetical protein FGO68_gene9025 [Halteria grandinella]